MKSRIRFWTGMISAAGLLVLIVDAKTALGGARDGVSLCMYTVIPSLFPFFVFSVLLNSTLSGFGVKGLRPFGKLCGIPSGAESLLLLGLLGGYPVGAQCVAEACRAKRLRWQDARRMLGFCSNAGPAFIFGMGSCLFQSNSALWALWGIHVLSALIVGALLPGKSTAVCSLDRNDPITITQALEKSVKTMAAVCGWVVLFRVLLAFLKRWFLWLIPQEIQILLTGFFELSNGCYELNSIPSEATRFILCSGMLGFGGICVGMQTASVTKELGTGSYFPGKVLQSAVSILLSCLVQTILFQEAVISITGVSAAALLTTILVLIVRHKKTVAILC